MPSAIVWIAPETSEAARATPLSRGVAALSDDKAAAAVPLLAQKSADPLLEGMCKRWRFRRADGMPWGLAGLWSEWKDPQTGEIKEWPSPSGPESHPYALAVVDGIVS